MKKLFIILLLLLNLNSFSQSKIYYSGDTKDLGLGLTLGGISFTVAATLEGSYQYGTYVKQPNGKEKYVIPDFWGQTPRNIMFVVGGTLTITGLLTIKHGE